MFRLDVVPEISAQLADILKRMAAAPVKHPAVVGIIDAGLEGTSAFLAMEYVAAETLDVNLRRFAPAGLETAVPMLRQVAEALEAGWAAGMGHGSLHPRDIFVVPPTADSPHGQTVLRVSGFGVTDALEELRIPTPVRRPYNAPEREQAGEWDIRADVYSLGIIAHELLTGRRPTDSLELDEELPEDTSDAQRTAIRQALSGALAANPDDRFHTPMAFVDALTTEAPPAQLPWPVEVENDARDVLADEEPDAQLGFDEPDGPAEMEEEPPSIWMPRPDSDPEPELERETPSATSAVPVPAFLGVPAQPDRREPFQPFIDAPKENVMPRTLVVAALALAVGTGFGYWLRGPAPAAPLVVNTAEATSAPAATKGSAEEPIGTDVTVGTPTPAPASGSPSTTAANAVTARGRLLIRSVPSGAAVAVDGIAMGTSPATIRDLPFGTYAVAVSRSGYQRREQNVTISQAVPAREVTFELKSSSPPEGRAPARGATTGSVRVETRPSGAVVSIDGKRVGTAPLRIPLAPGPHKIRLSLAGHKTVTTTAVVRAGQQTLVRLSLEIQ